MVAHPDGARRAVIVVSSHVVRGTVGNRAAVFALESLGHPVWAVPTVVLPWHPGHGKGTRIVPPPADFARLIDDLVRSPWLAEVGGVVSGYLADPAQADAVAGLVAAVKTANPKAIYVCDPILGDSGATYVPEAVALAIRDRLMPIADIATPNRFELEWLTGRQAGDIPSAIAAAEVAGPARMLVTSAPAMLAGGIGNLYVTPSEAMLAEHRMIPGSPHGTGDLVAALILARFLAGQPAAKALQSTTASVYEVLARASGRGSEELQLETDMASLAHPMAMVQFRHLARPGPGRRA